MSNKNLTDTKYNGWTNYETWAVKLWMDNEQSSYRYWNEIAKEIWDATEDYTPAYKSQTRPEYYLIQLSDQIKGEYEDAMQLLLEDAKQECSVWADLLGAALGEVNWYEIAENYLSDITMEQLVENDAQDEVSQ